MYLHRKSENLLIRYLKSFPVTAVMGPRQSGKSTMVKELLTKDYEYITFDDFSIRQIFHDDPYRFLKRYNNKVIFDEVQYLPDIFPFIKIAVDNDRDNYGKFVLTGSGQFLLSKNISESLAGRIGLLTLLPFQYSEVPDKIRNDLWFKGAYPELVNRNYNEYQLWYKAYLETYLQKDLRQILNVSDLNAFTTFIKMLAFRCGQIINLSAISRDIGIQVNTLKRWISVLEASYIVFTLQPWYKNEGSRMMKSPKIYFYDNGLLAFLCGIGDFKIIEQNPVYGTLFENFVISEFIKENVHSGRLANLFYFRTSNQTEIDLVIELENKITLAEIKASHTYRPLFHKSFTSFKSEVIKQMIIYQGNTREIDEKTTAMNFNELLNSNSIL